MTLMALDIPIRPRYAALMAAAGTGLLIYFLFNYDNLRRHDAVARHNNLQDSLNTFTDDRN